MTTPPADTEWRNHDNGQPTCRELLERIDELEAENREPEERLDEAYEVVVRAVDDEDVSEGESDGLWDERAS